MAFNPFHAFRKRKKVLFAALTVVCMITFVLSTGTLSGGGDPFSELQRWITGQASKHAVVFLYGKEVDQAQVLALQRQRRVVNEFIVRAVLASQANIMRTMESSLRSNVFAEPYKAQLDSIVRDWLIGFDPNYEPFAGMKIPAQDRLSRQQLYLFSIPQHLSTLEQVQNSLVGEKKEGEAARVALVRRVLQQDQALHVRVPGDIFFRLRSDSYFGGSPAKLEDLLDFIIWRHQADRLGIRLTDQDIKAEFRNETLGHFTSRDSVTLVNELQRRVGRWVTVDYLFAALGDEFRVRLARMALEGYEAERMNVVPAPVTPYAFWEFYQDQCAPIRVALLPVPVREFVAQVKDRPTEDELKDLFDKGKDREYTPDASLPSFRLPLRFQVEWVAGRPTSAFYRRAAQVQYALNSALATAPTHTALAAALAGQMVQNYDAARYQYELPPWNERQFVSSIYANQVRPENFAASVGQAIGAAGTGFPPLAGYLALQATAVAQAGKDLDGVIKAESQKRLAAGLTVMLAGWTPSPLAAESLWFYGANQREYVSPDALKSRLVEQVHKNLARDLLIANLGTVEKEVAKRGRPRDKKDVRAYLAEAVKKYDLETGSTTELRDRYTVFDDPGLKPLRESYLREQRSDPKGNGFFRELQLGQRGTYAPKPWPTVSGFERFDVDQKWKNSTQPFLVWKTEEKSDMVPDFATVRGKVEDYWRWQKARDLARQAAEKLADRARETKGDLPGLRDLAAKHKAEVIELGPMAKLMPQPAALAGRARTYQTYDIPADTKEKLTYPGQEFVADPIKRRDETKLVDTVLNLRDKMPGESLVVPDAPEATYYLAVLASRQTPSESDFFKTYERAATGATESDTLWTLFEEQRRATYREEVIARLRREAGLGEIDPDKRKMFETEDIGVLE